MSRRSCRSLLLVPVLGLAAACGRSNNTTTPTGPSAPPTPITLTFSGTLTRNAAYKIGRAHV